VATHDHRSIATQRPHCGGFAAVLLFSFSVISAKVTCEAFDIAANTGGVRSENRLSLNTVTMWTNWP
jgi:hypothetical protein